MPLASNTEHIPERISPLAIEPIAVRVRQACAFIGTSRSTLYLLIAAGEIEIIKLGSTTLVLTDSLRRLVEQRRHHVMR